MSHNTHDAPWRQEEGTFGKDFKVVDSSQRTIARIPWTRGDVGPLIAAAPELLELLEAIVDRTKPAHLAEGITKAPTAAQIEAARSIIAKAKGDL